MFKKKIRISNIFEKLTTQDLSVFLKICLIRTTEVTGKNGKAFRQVTFFHPERQRRV